MKHLSRALFVVLTLCLPIYAADICPASVVVVVTVTNLISVQPVLIDYFFDKNTHITLGNGYTFEVTDAPQSLSTLVYVSDHVQPLSTSTEAANTGTLLESDPGSALREDINVLPVPNINLDRDDPNNWTPSTVALLDYAEPSGLGTTAVSLRFQMLVPQVTLENIADIVDVTCANQIITLLLRNEDALARSNQWPQINLVLITNHAGCNPVDERGVYLVKGFTSVLDSLSIVLNVFMVGWKDVAESMKISYGNIVTDISPQPAYTSTVTSYYYESSTMISTTYLTIIASSALSSTISTISEASTTTIPSALSSSHATTQSTSDITAPTHSITNNGLPVVFTGPITLDAAALQVFKSITAGLKANEAETILGDLGPQATQSASLIQARFDPTDTSQQAVLGNALLAAGLMSFDELFNSLSAVLGNFTNAKLRVRMDAERHARLRRAGYSFADFLNSLTVDECNAFAITLLPTATDLCNSVDGLNALFCLGTGCVNDLTHPPAVMQAPFDYTNRIALPGFSDPAIVYSNRDASTTIQCVDCQLSISRLNLHGEIEIRLSDAGIQASTVTVTQDSVASLKLKLKTLSADTGRWDYTMNAPSLARVKSGTVFTILPRVLYAIGAEFATDSATEFTAGASMTVLGSSVVLDLANGVASEPQNFQPTPQLANPNLSGTAQITLNTVMMTDVELSIVVLGNRLENLCSLTTQTSLAFARKLATRSGQFTCSAGSFQSDSFLETTSRASFKGNVTELFANTIANPAQCSPKIVDLLGTSTGTSRSSMASTLTISMRSSVSSSSTSSTRTIIPMPSTCVATFTDCTGLCVDTQTDLANCGACGNICTGDRTCDAGSCVCSNGWSFCSESQLCTNFDSDPANCGGCGMICATAQTCVAGSCACSNGQDFCSTSQICTDLFSDDANCGTCGRACPAAQLCVGGICFCPGGTSFCEANQICTDFATDSANCGACEVACSAGNVCTGGFCLCPGGQNFCPSTQTCADFNTDAKNCGGCGITCPAHQACNAGSCSTCSDGQDFCSTSQICTDLFTDNANCGMCGHACPAAQLCVGGICFCPGGTSFCAESGTCADFNSDPKNCGGCGVTCSANQACNAGSCSTCSDGRDFCPSSQICTDLFSDDANCGTCGNACATGQLCVGGICFCPGGTSFCAEGGTCVNFNADAQNCGGCGITCLIDQACNSGSCSTCSNGQDFCSSSQICTDVFSDDANCGTCGHVNLAMLEAARHALMGKTSALVLRSVPISFLIMQTVEHAEQRVLQAKTASVESASVLEVSLSVLLVKPVLTSPPTMQTVGHVVLYVLRVRIAMLELATAVPLTNQSAVR
ncbi:hypothetical protein BP6252_13066 [Coleophoma cylindrospora]|uniref:DUF7029 domain-containing protein n=1 Tax=Coleophoma cylindrospora TaxID=1849047 RepID=A0A3D8QA91_9HELO|nr:hypothetical protein BP6252_13066 [Coleophoma cylindrospora]